MVLARKSAPFFLIDPLLKVQYHPLLSSPSGQHGRVVPLSRGREQCVAV